MFDLHQLRMFLAVCEEENLTKAAARLYTTPPSVSAAIKALEGSLGVMLFERTSKGMCLTDAGRVLMDKARQVILAAEDVHLTARKLHAEVSGTIRLAINTTPELLQLGRITAYLQAHYPGVRLSIYGENSGTVMRKVAAGEMDAGFVFGPVHQPGLAARFIMEAELVICLPAQWEEVAEGDWEGLAARPWIYTEFYCPFQNITDELFARHGLTCARYIQSQTDDTKHALVLAGVGAAVIERSETARSIEAGRLRIWKHPAIMCPLSLVYPEHRETDPLIQSLFAALESLTPPRGE